MFLESYDHNQQTQTEEKNDALTSANQKEINVDAIDNINDQKSENVTEEQFDTWFKQGLQNLTKGPGFSGMFKTYNKDTENIFAKVDTNDNGTIDIGEYNAGKESLQKEFEQDVKKEFVDTEKGEVVAELNTVDEQKYDLVNSFIESIKLEIGPLQGDIIAKYPEAAKAVNDPFAYADEYKINREAQHIG